MVWILIASLLLSLLVGALRPTPLLRRISAHRAAGRTVALVSLAMVLGSVWRLAETWSDPGFPIEGPLGGFALAAFLVALALRRPLYPIGGAVTLGGALVAVGSTLPPP